MRGGGGARATAGVRPRHSSACSTRDSRSIGAVRAGAHALLEGLLKVRVHGCAALRHGEEQLAGDADAPDHRWVRPRHRHGTELARGEGSRRVRCIDASRRHICRSSSGAHRRASLRWRRVFGPGVEPHRHPRAPRAPCPVNAAPLPSGIPASARRSADPARRRLPHRMRLKTSAEALPLGSLSLCAREGCLGEGVGGARVAQRLRRRGARATGGAHHRGQRRVWAGAGGAAPRWAMHPHLDEVAHPACVEAIRALKVGSRRRRRVAPRCCLLRHAAPPCPALRRNHAG